MFVELYRGITLHPGTFTAVIAPERSVAAALSGNPDLRRFLLLVVSGPGSRLGPGIGRTFPDADIRAVATAGQLLTALRGVRHTLVLVGHDPALFDGEEAMIDPVAASLQAAGRESLVILHAESREPVFAALACQADRCIEIVPPDPTAARRLSPGTAYPAGPLPPAQTRLGVTLKRAGASQASGRK